MGGKDQQKRDCNPRHSSSPISHEPPTDKTLILAPDSGGQSVGSLRVPVEAGDDSASSSGSSSASSTPAAEAVGRKKRRHQRRLHHASTTDTENGSDVSSTLEREAPDGGYG